MPSFSACRQSLVYTLSDDEKRAPAIVFDLFGQKRQLTLSAYGLYGKRQLTK